MKLALTNRSRALVVTKTDGVCVMRMESTAMETERLLIVKTKTSPSVTVRTGTGFNCCVTSGRSGLGGGGGGTEMANTLPLVHKGRELALC